MSAAAVPRRWRRSSYGRRKRDRQRPRKDFAAFLYVSPFTASIWYLPIFDVCNQPAKHGSATGFLSNLIATRWNSCSSRHGDAFASSYSPSPGYSSMSPSHRSSLLSLFVRHNRSLCFLAANSIPETRSSRCHASRGFTQSFSSPIPNGYSVYASLLRLPRSFIPRIFL